MGEINKTDRLSLTPREGEARAQLSPSGRGSKEVGEGSSADVAEEAHGTPNAQPFDSAAVAEREERVLTIKNVIGNKMYAAVRDGPDVQHKRIFILVCRFDIRRETARAPHNVGPDGGGSKITPLCEVVCVFNFP